MKSEKRQTTSSFYSAMQWKHDKVALLVLAGLGVAVLVILFCNKNSSSKFRPYPCVDNPQTCCQEAVEYSLELLCSTKRGCNCTAYMMCKLVMVTPISSNHFEESKDYIGTVHKHLPNTRIIVYDVGLKEQEVRTLKSYCNIEVKTFDFNKYPKYTRDLNKYAFKGFIMEEMSKTHELFFFCDASCRLLSSLEHILPFLLDFPFLPLTAVDYPMVKSTHDGMLSYLRINMSRLELTKYIGIQSGLYIMWTTELMNRHLIQPWVDCSRHIECISPKGAFKNKCRLLDLHVKENFLTSFSGCHRYDQSALNMILIREFGLSAFNKFATIVKRSKGVVTVERKSSKKYTSEIRVCEH